MMLTLLKQFIDIAAASNAIAKRASKWFGVLLFVLFLFSAALLFFDAISMSLALDSGQAINPYFACAVLTLAAAAGFYSMVWLLCLPVISIARLFNYCKILI